MKRIPVLIVSGFLGAGKTTLVRRLLADAQAEGARVAFISNELGALGVDQALLGGGAEAMVELAGGCVCCALNDELYETLIRLHEQVDPDRIVIETSGVAIPHDVQITLYQPPVRDWVEEEAVVTVVNAEQVAEGRDLEGAFSEQVESADLVVLHKVDLVSVEQIPALKEVIAALNPGVAVVAAVRGEVDGRLLLAGRDPNAATQHDNAATQHDHADHHHEVFDAQPLNLPDDLDLDALEARIRATGALRVKGFVSIQGAPHLVQGVGRRLEINRTDLAVPPELLGRVVIIRRVS